MKVDFNGLEGNLGVGQYVGIVKGISYTIDENKGTALVSFKVDVNGKERRTKLYQTEGKGVFFLYEALTNLGIDVPKSKVELDDFNLTGIKAEFTVNEREWNGKKYFDLEPTRALGKATDAEMVSLSSG